MKTFLKKKLFKTIPIWSIIALILSTTIAIGAITWISNTRITNVTVSEWEIYIDEMSEKLSEYKVGTSYESIYPYTVNEVADSTGYLCVEFGTSLTLTDVALNFVIVRPSGGSAVFLQKITGYPTIDGGIVYYWGESSSTPYDFSAGDQIQLSWVPKADTINKITVRITSDLPEL